MKIWRLNWRVDHIYSIVEQNCQNIEWFPENERVRMTGWVDKGWWKIDGNPYASHLYLDKPENMINIINYIKKNTEYPIELELYIKQAKSTLRQEKIERILNENC